MALVHRQIESDLGLKMLTQCRMSFSIIKSRTLVYVFVLAALGTFFVESGTKVPDLFVLARLSLSVYFLALATYLYNDLTDYDVDEVNNRHTASSKRSSYLQTLYHTIGFFAVSILLAFSINVQTGFISLGFLALAILYSHPKTHLKDRFVLKTVTTAAGGSLAALMGCFASDAFSYLGIISSLISFMFWFTLGPLGDVSDINGDKANGRRTFPIVLGVDNTFRIMHIVVISIISLIVAIYCLHNINTLGLILSISACLFVSYTIIRVSKNYQEKKIIKQTRTTLRYSLFLIQIMFVLGFVLDNMLFSA
ncbi:MAG: UbiA prenyltransferase family protein [Thaumarchaeota archaeon]|nr:UbiA prenyltransferase family protein [Nitrososphaerota archaeon]MDE1876585.1 UbiA prenyltransferase family protein [Nitrososphaerota archaeon]